MVIKLLSPLFNSALVLPVWLGVPSLALGAVPILTRRLSVFGVATVNRKFQRNSKALGFGLFPAAQHFPFATSGPSYFYSAHLNGEGTTEAFHAATVRHLEEIFIGVLHAGCGYLAAFFGHQNMQAQLKAEEKIFTRLLDLSSKPSSAFPCAPILHVEDGNEQSNDAEPINPQDAAR